MSKVASLAHSVNMEFETTTAFLAQGIETTREAAETVGTASISRRCVHEQASKLENPKAYIAR